MNTDNNSQVVDGFSDAKGETNVDAPDLGVEKNAKKPLSPEEYAKAQKEIREEGDKNDLTDRKAGA